jgi:3-oxoacyl-[acyl-carrier protein] reductase
MATIAVVGSGGIGSELASRLAAAGHTVVIGRHHARSGDDPSPGAVEIVVDATDFDSCRRFLAEARRAVGKINAVVNCFGCTRYSPVIQDDAESIAEMFRVNVGGVLNMSRVAASSYIKSGGTGVILNFSSVAAQSALPGLAAYGASKAAVVALTRSMAMELAPWKIRANIIVPGFVEAGMTSRQSPSQQDIFRRHIPLNAFSSVSEISHLVSWLVSDDARTVTGQTFVVDGGLTLGPSALFKEIVENWIKEKADA